MRTLAETLSIDLPQSRWRQIEERSVWVEASQFETCRGDLQQNRFILSIRLFTHPEAGTRAWLDELFRSRSPYGPPEVSTVVVAGAPALHVRTSDGVSCSHSYFIQRPPDGVVEVTLMSYLEPSGTTAVDLEAVSAEIFRSFTWLQLAEDASHPTDTARAGANRCPSIGPSTERSRCRTAVAGR